MTQHKVAAFENDTRTKFENKRGNIKRLDFAPETFLALVESAMRKPVQ